MAAIIQQLDGVLVYPPILGVCFNARVVPVSCCNADFATALSGIKAPVKGSLLQQVLCPFRYCDCPRERSLQDTLCSVLRLRFRVFFINSVTSQAESRGTKLGQGGFL